MIITDDTRYVATVHAVDPEPGTTINYSIVGGADQKLFGIDPTTGVLTFKNEPQGRAQLQRHGCGLRRQPAGHADHQGASRQRPVRIRQRQRRGHIRVQTSFRNCDYQAFRRNVVAAHDVLELDHTLFRNADANASPAATFDLIQHHSFQLGNDVIIVTDSHDVIDLRNTDVHALTAINFLLI